LFEVEESQVFENDSKNFSEKAFSAKVEGCYFLRTQMKWHREFQKDTKDLYKNTKEKIYTDSTQRAIYALI